MAHDPQKEKRKFVEFSTLFVDYSNGDVVIFDNVKDLASLYSAKSLINLMVFCTQGCSKLSMVNGTSITVNEGDLLYCTPNTIIKSNNYDKDFECIALCISDHIVQGLLRDKADLWHRSVYNNQHNIIHLSPPEQEEFQYYFALIDLKTKQREIKTPHEIVQSLIRAMLLDLCFLLQDKEGIVSQQKLSQGKILFNRFINHLSKSEIKRLPISHYASGLAITPKYLTMLCLKYSNKTASQWIIDYTIEDIRFYLRSSNLSIKEISAKLGFANMSHFGSYVRKHLGMSPSEFREN